MVDKQSPPLHSAPVITTAVVASNYLVALADVPGIRAGQVVPNTPENAKALGDKFRPATDVDIGVAGIIRKV